MKDRTLKLSEKTKQEESLSWSREVFLNGSQKAQTIRRKIDNITQLKFKNTCSLKGILKKMERQAPETERRYW